MMNTTKLVTRQEMAAILNISPRHLWRLQSTGRIPAIRLGKAIRFDVEDTLQRLKNVA